MEKNHFQLELFSSGKEQSSTKNQISHAFLKYIRAYEKTIVITIGLLTTGVISFSLGVEKGKRLIILKTDSHLDIALKQQGNLEHNRPNIVEQKPKSQPAKNEPKEYNENYTIQIASYRTKTHAQVEVATLKKKGLSSFVLSKGKFSIVCVGNFPKQESAKTLLAQLKKRYRDCYIRRL